MQALFLEKQFFFPGLSRARFKQQEDAGRCPDLSPPLTSLVTVSQDKAQVLMACDVPSITLAELFYHYSDEHTYDTLLKVWLEGRIVSRGRKNRGRSSTAPKKNKNKRRKRTPRQLVVPQAACAETGSTRV